MGLSRKILIGLFAGIATGLFFGELVAGLAVIGDIFVMLLQMTVLPYIMVSLITGFGSMRRGRGGKLFVRGLLMLLVVWALALSMIFVAPLAFPKQEGAFFFGSMVPPEPRETNLLELYFPANIFYSLSRNLVPAVVVFSIFLGVGLISVHEKTALMKVLKQLAEGLGRVNHVVIRLTPVGIFTIAAAAAGTVTIEEVGRVQVYLVTYIGIAMMSALWIFPGLVGALSELRYREIMASFQESLVTAFATGNQFVVLPQIIEKSKELLARHHGASEERDQTVDVIVPIIFNFPSLGKLLVLLFVLFAAWFSDIELGTGERVSLAVSGLVSLFGSINVAVPYLLDELRIPADMFQLFLVTGVVLGRFGAMLAALHIVVVSLLATLALEGSLRVRKRRVLVYLLGTGLVLAVMISGLRTYFTLFVPAAPPREQVLAEMQLMQPRVPAAVFDELPEREKTRIKGSRLDHILERGSLRVGYRPDNLPCSFITPQYALVGFDVEMAHILAEDMGLRLEFVPFEFEILGDLLDSGQIDIAMSCIASLPDRYRQASFSRSYLDLTLAIVTPDYRREDFYDFDKLRRSTDLTLALVGSHYFEPSLKRLFPGIHIVRLERAEDFFTGQGPKADALVLSAEEGAAYTFRYPSYTVIQPPSGVTIRIPAAYAVPRGDAEMVEFVSNWVELKQKSGVSGQLYNYWMLGGVSRERQPRWSIIRNVLGWVD